jgi:hypothetical protein
VRRVRVVVSRTGTLLADKHGTCAADGTMSNVTDELSFFKTALQLQKQFNLLVSEMVNGWMCWPSR